MENVYFNEMEREKLSEVMKSILLILEKEPEERAWNALHKMYIYYSMALNIDINDIFYAIEVDYDFLNENR